MSFVETAQASNSNEAEEYPVLHEWVSRVSFVEELIEEGLTIKVPTHLRCNDPACPSKNVHHAGPYRADPRVPDQADMPFAPRDVYLTMDSVEYMGEPTLLPGETEIPDYVIELHASRTEFLKKFDEVHSWIPVQAGKGVGKKGQGKGRKGKKVEKNWQAKMQNGPKPLMIGSRKKVEDKGKQADPAPETTKPKAAEKAAQDKREASILSDPSDTTDTSNIRNASLV